MKGIIIAAILITGQITIANANNVQRRACLTNNSIWWNLDITEPTEDNVGFCKWGEAMVGSISMVHYYYNQTHAMAMSAFYQTKNQIYTSCEAASAQETLGTDSNAATYKLCVFPDYSFIRKSTLRKGWYAAENVDLRNNL